MQWQIRNTDVKQTCDGNKFGTNHFYFKEKKSRRRKLQKGVEKYCLTKEYETQDMKEIEKEITRKK